MLYSEQRCGKEGRVRKTRRERESRGRTLWGSRKTSLSSDSSDWCRIKIVKTIFCCGLRVMFRKARDRGERLVSGRRRQRMNWSRRWAEHHYNQHRFFQALAEKGASRRENEMGLMKYRSIFRLWLWRRAGWEKLLKSDLSDIMICRATWRAGPGSVWREWRGESVE